MKTQQNKTDFVISNLSDLLNKGNAHVSMDEALQGIDFDLSGKKIPGMPYSLWQLADHIRIAQWDILEFSRNVKHLSPEWPDGYWPVEIKPASEAIWKKCIRQIKSDRISFIELLSNKGVDIYQPFNYGTGQSLLKEALVLADHNSYHTGQIILLRRMFNNWKK